LRAAKPSVVHAIGLALCNRALANKLARIAWSVLRNEKTFDAPRHEVTAI